MVEITTGSLTFEKDLPLTFQNIMHNKQIQANLLFNIGFLKSVHSLLVTNIQKQVCFLMDTVMVVQYLWNIFCIADNNDWRHSIYKNLTKNAFTALVNGQRHDFFFLHRTQPMSGQLHSNTSSNLCDNFESIIRLQKRN